AAGAACRGGCAGGDGPLRPHGNGDAAAAGTAAITLIAVHFRPPFSDFDPRGATSSARLIPSGVSSNAHARIKATGNPRMTAVTNTFITHGGASKVGNRIEAAWINSHATIAYATATLSTLRRFSSVRTVD